MLSPGHGIAVASMNSQKLWLLTLDLYKIKLGKKFQHGNRVCVCVCVANPEAPPLAEELLGVDGTWGMNSHFSSCSHWYVPRVSLDYPRHMYI